MSSSTESWLRCGLLLSFLAVGYGRITHLCGGEGTSLVEQHLCGEFCAAVFRLLCISETGKHLDVHRHTGTCYRR